MCVHGSIRVEVLDKGTEDDHLKERGRSTRARCTDPRKLKKKEGGHREKIGRKLEAATSCAPWSRAPAALAGVAQELAEDESPPFSLQTFGRYLREANGTWGTPNLVRFPDLASPRFQIVNVELF